MNVNQKALNFIGLVAVLLLFAIAIHHIEAGFNEQYKTEDAVKYSSADTVSFKGIYIRDEEVIKKRYNGVLSYPVKDGGKVAKDSVVAYLYNSEEEIETNRHIEELEHEVALLRSAQNPGTVQTAEPDFISPLIAEQYQTIASLLAKGDIEDLKARRDNLFTLMCIYQLAIGQEQSYDERIADLSAEISEKRVDRKRPKGSVTSPDSGYFVSYTDGYETELTFDTVDDITSDRIKQIIEEEKERDYHGKYEIGKLVKGYNWKIVGIVDNSSSAFNPGDTVKLSFASVPDTVTATIEMLRDTDVPEETVIVLRCEENTYGLVRLRTDRVDMTLHDFEGIRVPKQAIRFNKDNEKGCYILIGQNVKFRKIDEIYAESDYVLSRITSDDEYVSVFDKVITSGVDTAAYYETIEENLAAEKKNAERKAMANGITATETTAAETEETTETQEISEEKENGDTEETGETDKEDDSEETEPSEEHDSSEGEIRFE